MKKRIVLALASRALVFFLPGCLQRAANVLMSCFVMIYWEPRRRLKDKLMQESEYGGPAAFTIDLLVSVAHEIRQPKPCNALQARTDEFRRG